MGCLKLKACLMTVYPKVPWPLSGVWVLTGILGPSFSFQAFRHPGVEDYSVGCWGALSNALSRKKSNNTHLLWLLVGLGDFPQVVGAASKLMVILFFFTSQERPKLVVSSELLVSASEPSEKREQRPCNFEWHLSEQCDYAVHADKWGFDQDV